MLKANKIVGYTTGVFDMFHIGHLNLLKRAKLECDYLVVGVTSDELVSERKSVKPIIPFIERMSIVENIIFVDEVVPQTTMNKLYAWNDIHFDRMFVGDDWKGTETWKNIEAQFIGLPVEIIYLPYTNHTSSTKLRSILDRLHEGE